MAPPAKQVLNLNALPTSHVILYPSRAHITRSIGDLKLQPGPNEIEIYGLTPTADEHSIKVDGTGAASITDMIVDLVPNRESFEDVYPDDSDSEYGSDDESDSDSDAAPDVTNLRDELRALRNRYNRNEESKWLSQKAMDLFNDYCAKVEAKDMDLDAAEKLIERYRERRFLKHDEVREALELEDALRKELNRKEHQLRLATKEDREQKRRKQKQAWMAKEKKKREKLEKMREKRVLRDERAKFWPKKVYRVIVHLDAASDTPGSSRRSSVSSLATLQQESVSKQKAVESEHAAHTVSLTLSYVTSEASWSPRYDIAFTTLNKSGSIAYRAEFKNLTSETWKDTRVSLSTSQASFRGLDDELPFMHPWHLGLVKGGQPHGFDPPGLTSVEEQAHKVKKQEKTVFAGVNSRDLFGIPAAPRAVKFGDAEPDDIRDKKRERVFAKIVPSQQTSVAQGVTGALFGAQNQSAFGNQHQQQGRSGLFGSSNQAGFGGQQAAPGGGLFGGSAQNGFGSQGFEGELPTRRAAAAPPISLESYIPESADDRTLAEDSGLPPTIEFEESTWEDHGLTQTYDLPGTRTLEPSSLTRRSKIATLPFTNLVLSSVSVPKLRAASFLRARFRNPSSSLTLLKGTAGVTLDGTFLGNTTLQRIAPGDPITLPLGVDPAVQISYAKPTVKRSTQGVFTKEANQIFTRSIIITNGKPVAAELVVLDQVPISEDEKLRIELLQPKGLVKDGDVVQAGANAKQGRNAGEKWGKATATLKKDGQIAWNVNLEKGAACRLAVEYEVRTPSNEWIVSK